MWDRVLDATGHDYRGLWIYGTTLYSVLVVSAVGGLFLLMDVTGYPKFMRKYKIQPGTNDPLTTEQLIKVYWICIGRVQIVVLMSIDFS